jgi:hypothetical protein
MLDRWPMAVRTALAGAMLAAMLLIIAIVAGRGNTTLLRLLFPVALYFRDWTHSEFCFVIAALMQWPIYGAVLGWAIDKRTILACSAMMAVAILHMVLTWVLA